MRRVAGDESKRHRAKRFIPDQAAEDGITCSQDVDRTDIVATGRKPAAGATARRYAGERHTRGRVEAREAWLDGSQRVVHLLLLLENDALGGRQ